MTISKSGICNWPNFVVAMFGISKLLFYFEQLSLIPLYCLLAHQVRISRSLQKEHYILQLFQNGAKNIL